MENYLLESIAEQRRELDKVEDAVRRIMPLTESYPFWVSTNVICTRVDHNIDSVRKLRAALGSEWMREKRDSALMDDGELCLTYRNRCDVRLFVYTQMDRKICKRIKVGEKTVPIYKVECSTVDETK